MGKESKRKTPDTVFSFTPFDTGQARDQERLNILAVCIATQQAAGFDNRLDTREAKCHTCNASGFNTGFGYWQFACGATLLSDGEPDDHCPKEKVKKNA